MVSRGMVWRIGSTTICVLLVITSVVLAEQNRRLLEANDRLAERSSRPYPGLVVPATPSSTLDGTSVVLGAPEPGGQQVLFFFTTTCAFCRAAIPSWHALARRISGIPGVEVYGVALDSVDSLQTYVTNAGFAFPIVVLSDLRAPALYRLKAVPLTLVVSDSGTVLYSHFGSLDSLAHFDSLIALLARKDASRR